MNKLINKAEQLGYPHSNLRVVICFNSQNSTLAQKLGRDIRQEHPVQEIVEKGVLIGKIGHLQLIEWNFIEDIY